MSWGCRRNPGEVKRKERRERAREQRGGELNIKQVKQVSQSLCNVIKQNIYYYAAEHYTTTVQSGHASTALGVGLGDRQRLLWLLVLHSWYGY